MAEPHIGEGFCSSDGTMSSKSRTPHRSHSRWGCSDGSLADLSISSYEVRINRYAQLV